MDFSGSDIIGSECGAYQYLRRIDLQSGNGKICVVIGLNPALEIDGVTDPAVAICGEFAKRLGYSTLVLVNLFAVQSKGAQGVPMGKDPIGPENNKWILEAAKQAHLIVAAWGDYPRIGSRVTTLLSILKPFDIHCVQANRNGTPTHPLAWRQKAPKLYRGRVADAQLPVAG